MNKKVGVTLIALFLVCVSISIGSLSQSFASEHSQNALGFKSCAQDTVRQKKRSAELQALVVADQNDRKSENIDWDVVAAHDEKRSRRVGEIFGEGCLSTGADYSAAALIFQHGPAIDHNFQAYLWAKRALELGDSTRKEIIVEGIDRFLVRQGFKQLFARITHRIRSQRCRCLDDVEETFPDSKRVKMGGKSIADALKEISDFNHTIEGCDDVKFCGGLSTPPEGIIPGIW